MVMGQKKNPETDSNLIHFVTSTIYAIYKSHVTIKYSTRLVQLQQQ